LLTATAVSIVMTVAPAAAGVGPSLRVPDVTPFTVKGVHFRAAERIAVTVRVKRRFVHTVTASPRGTFVTRFRTLRLAECQAYAVTAVGNQGSRAFLKVVPLCPPPGPIG
jgi:hypothetical protein